MGFPVDWPRRQRIDKLGSKIPRYIARIMQKQADGIHIEQFCQFVYDQAVGLA